MVLNSLLGIIFQALFGAGPFNAGPNTAGFEDFSGLAHIDSLI